MQERCNIIDGGSSPKFISQKHICVQKSKEKKGPTKLIGVADIELRSVIVALEVK